MLRFFRGKICASALHRNMYCADAVNRKFVFPSSQARFFSTPAQQSDDEDNLEEDDNDDGLSMPYIPLNTSQLVHKNEENKDEDIEIWNQFIKLPDPNCAHIFRRTYVELLNAIAKQDKTNLRILCEGNLSTEFRQSLDRIMPQVQAIEVFNKPDENASESDLEKLIKVEVIDFDQTTGAYIDRAKNADFDVRPISLPFKRMAVRAYQQDVTKVGQEGHWVSVCITLTLKVSTPIKLDIVLPGDKSLLREYEKDNDDKEIHYMTVECETDRHYMKMSSFSSIIKSLFGMTRT